MTAAREIQPPRETVAPRAAVEGGGMRKPGLGSLISGLVSVAVVGAILGIGAGSLAVVAVWMVRLLT